MKKPESLKIFLEYVGLTEKEFYEITTSMAIPPYGMICQRMFSLTNVGILTNGTGRITE